MVVKCPRRAYLAAWIYLVGILSCTAMMIALFFLVRRPSWLETAALVAAGAICLGAIVWWIRFYFTRFVVWAELDDQFRFCTNWGERCVSWSEVGRFVLLPPNQPLHGLSIINAMLTDGTRLVFWTATAQAETAWETVARKPWARDWNGAPLGTGLALIALLLGIAALGFGLLVGYLLFDWYFSPIRKNVLPLDIRLQLLAVIGGPLVGSAGIVFGGYHLLRQPPFYRATVMRWDELPPRTLRESVRQLFSKPE